MSDLSEILKSRQLSLTKSRIRLLKILADTGFPISGGEIEKKINGKCDRATIYRNLNILTAKGIIQRVLSGNSVRFKFNPDFPEMHPEKDHIHFQCEICRELVCMEELLVEDFPLPDGYLKTENQFLIIGICKKCNEAGKTE